MKNFNQEVISRIKTLAWSALWVAVAAVADHSLASLGILNLPTIDLLGMQVNTAIVVGLVLNQISKFAHNVRNEKVY